MTPGSEACAQASSHHDAADGLGLSGYQDCHEHQDRALISSLRKPSPQHPAGPVPRPQDCPPGTPQSSVFSSHVRVLLVASPSQLSFSTAQRSAAQHSATPARSSLLGGSSCIG
ncbi:hypothetical protein F4679DRAFT_469789 [Xylaria curta]|nr:hypothetical protein F4679DRAFT_469789 [Xylaria curta]